ncbi:MAG: phosphoserine phosphatase SerB [Comamonadaceae bacterium]|nr:phosphoserine phosphatase SerB [Comamonadaceae bacterium]
MTAPSSAPLHSVAPGLAVRGFTPPLRLGDFRLIAFDMDSTLINIECVDEIAAAMGRGAEVAAITEAAMRGEITDFKDSLRRRVALLAGATEAQLEQVWRERLRLNPGADTLVRTARAAGLKVLLVSGGFTWFADRLRPLLGLDFARSNQLEMAEGRLTGRLLPQCWGDIVDGAMKRQTLLDVCSLLGIDPAQAIAVGDGANDLEMMAAAGLSVAYHAKPRVREHARVLIDEGGLDRLLHVLTPPGGAPAAAMPA